MYIYITTALCTSSRTVHRVRPFSLRRSIPLKKVDISSPWQLILCHHDCWYYVTTIVDISSPWQLILRHHDSWYYVTISPLVEHSFLTDPSGLNHQCKSKLFMFYTCSLQVKNLWQTIPESIVSIERISHNVAILERPCRATRRVAERLCSHLWWM